MMPGMVNDEHDGDERKVLEPHPMAERATPRGSSPGRRRRETWVRSRTSTFTSGPPGGHDPVLRSGALPPALLAPAFPPFMLERAPVLVLCGRADERAGCLRALRAAREMYPEGRETAALLLLERQIRGARRPRRAGGT